MYAGADGLEAGGHATPRVGDVWQELPELLLQPKIAAMLEALGSATSTVSPERALAKSMVFNVCFFDMRRAEVGSCHAHSAQRQVVMR